MREILSEGFQTRLPVEVDLENICAVTQAYKLVYSSGIDPGEV